jgi:hypothetical protein
MSLFTNVYDAETDINNAITPLFTANMVINDVDIDAIDNQIFKGMVKADAVACLIQYASFRLISKSKLNQKMQVQYKLVVFAPRESYKEIAGVKFVQVAKALKTITPAGACTSFQQIDDGRDFNQPEFLIDLVALPMLVGFDVNI